MNFAEQNEDQEEQRKRRAPMTTSSEIALTEKDLAEVVDHRQEYELNAEPERRLSSARTSKVWIIEGREFASSAAAARALGFSPTTIQRGCQGFTRKGQQIPARDGWSVQILAKEKTSRRSVRSQFKAVLPPVASVWEMSSERTKQQWPPKFEGGKKFAPLGAWDTPMGDA